MAAVKYPLSSTWPDHGAVAAVRHSAVFAAAFWDPAFREEDAEELKSWFFKPADDYSRIGMAVAAALHCSLGRGWLSVILDVDKPIADRVSFAFGNSTQAPTTGLEGKICELVASKPTVDLTEILASFRAEGVSPTQWLNEHVLGTTLDGQESLQEALRLISLLMDVYVEGANDTMVDLAASLIDERIVEWTKGLRGERHWFSR